MDIIRQEVEQYGHLNDEESIAWIDESAISDFITSTKDNVETFLNEQFFEMPTESLDEFIDDEDDEFMLLDDDDDEDDDDDDDTVF
jgi:hypothetical protein